MALSNHANREPKGILCHACTQYERNCMIQISSLWSLENIEDFYFITESKKVININTGQIKKPTKSKKRGYWYYTLQTKDKKQKKVYVHKIIALAFIKNQPYEIIEHLDDDKDNNEISNL